MNKISHFVFNIFLTQNIGHLMEINLYKIYLPLFSPFSNNTKESGNFLKKLLSYNVLSTHLNWITNLVYCVYCLVTQGIYELVVLLKIVKSVIVIAKTKSSKNYLVHSLKNVDNLLKYLGSARPDWDIKKVFQQKECLNYFQTKYCIISNYY